MSLPYCLLRPLIFQLEPETAHGLTIKALKTGLAPSARPAQDPALHVSICGLNFPNPIGLAAGFDKNAEAVAPLFNLGFGFVEVGTVTPEPQAGNPKPRVFRDPGSGSLINALGFPNVGLNIFKKNMEAFRAHPSSVSQVHGPVGINIGMNKDQTEPEKDYTLLVRELGPLADYLTVNISSPNTPGLRNLQEPETLKALLGTVLEERDRTCSARPPLFVKLAPDLSEKQREEIAAALLDSGVDGLILTNTTLDRSSSLPSDFASQKGGLSGTPLKDKSTQSIRDFYGLTGGKLPIIGVGGVSSGEDAYEKIKAGASLVQLYTGLVYKGPSLPGEICRTLSQRLKEDGFSSVKDAAGTAG